MKDGNLNGQGTYTWPNGDKYAGEWKNGNASGQGTFTFADADGRKYVGEWKDDEYNGQGTYTWAVGDKFIGKIDKTHDLYKGEIIYKNGNKYRRNIYKINS